MADSIHKPISFNVGGVIYTTSFSTLQRCPESMLVSMVKQENIPLQKDKDNNIFIDRDGTTFRYILNYLRDGDFELPSTFTEYGQLLREVNFYQLGDHALATLTDHMAKKARAGKIEHVAVLTKDDAGNLLMATSDNKAAFLKSSSHSRSIVYGLYKYYYHKENSDILYAALLKDGFRKEPSPDCPGLFVKEKEL